MCIHTYTANGYSIESTWLHSIYKSYFFSSSVLVFINIIYYEYAHSTNYLCRVYSPHIKRRERERENKIDRKKETNQDNWNNIKWWRFLHHISFLFCYFWHSIKWIDCLHYCSWTYSNINSTNYYYIRLNWSFKCCHIFMHSNAFSGASRNHWICIRCRNLFETLLIQPFIWPPKIIMIIWIYVVVCHSNLEFYYFKLIY